MNTYLRQHVIGPAPEVPISDAQFEAAKSARVVLTAAFALEESFDLLIGNYIEVEQELLTAAAANAARSTNTYEDFFELRSTVNRRVVNLLTAGRLYLDQAPQHLAKCAQDATTARADFKKRTNDHYDASFAYRFLEALRNHVQHCGLAVHRLSINRAGETRELELSIQPFAEKRYLAEDAQFKRRVLVETPDQVVLTKVIREYLQCLGDVHNLVRSHVAVNVEAAPVRLRRSQRRTDHRSCSFQRRPC